MSDDEIIHEWLSLAYGKEEAENAMRLPPELRDSLYENVLRYGPAGETIVSFLTAMAKTRNESKVFQLYWKGVFEDLSSGWFDSFLFKGKGITLDDLVFENSLEGSWGLINSELSQTSHALQGSPEAVMGLNFMLWMLNGQYLFPASAMMLDSHYMALVNELLVQTGLPKLSGAFLEVN